MGWHKSGSHVLNEDNPNLVTNVDRMESMVILSHHFADTGTMQQLLRFNQSEATDYAYRRSENGNADTSSGTQSFIGGFQPASSDGFNIHYVVDTGDEEVLTISFGVGGGGAGETNDPERREVVGKYVGGKIDKVGIDVSVASNFELNSDLSVIGTTNDLDKVTQ